MMNSRPLAALLALALLLGGCAGNSAAVEPPRAEPFAAARQNPDAPPPSDAAPLSDDVTLREPGGLTVAIPTRYVDALVIETESEAWSDHWEPLLSLSEKASVEAYAAEHDEEDWAVGWLCSVSRLDRIGFETWLGGSEAGASVFARDDADNYYLIAYPTDVSLYRAGFDDGGAVSGAELGLWNELNGWARALPDDIIARNGLTPYDASDLLDADYTYGGAHVELGCSFPGEAMDHVVFSLSQPERQGEGGVWCVERVRYVYGEYDWTETQIVFPAALGIDESAADYYARLQAACDAGDHPELLTPEGAALEFARGGMTWLLGEDVSASDFSRVEALG